jgi:hypothetical protein
VNLNNFSAVSSLTPWTTSATQNLADLSPIAISSPNFSYTMPALSVTTLVGTADPWNLALSNGSVVENMPAGTTVGTLSTDDASSDTFIYSLVAGDSSDGNGSFTISGDTLQAVGPLHYPGSYNVRVRTTNQNGFTNEKSFVVTVNQAPVVSGTKQLISTATLTKLGDGSFQAVVKLSNVGVGTAQNVVLNTAMLGNASGATIPQSLGNIPPGGYALTTISYPSTAGISGTMVIEKYSGAYDGGTFVGSIRATLP